MIPILLAIKSKLWEDNHFGLDKATLTRSFQKQLQIIKSQGTEEEKENATRLEKRFKVGITFVSYNYNNCRLVATFRISPLQYYSYPWSCVFAWLWTASPL